MLELDELRLEQGDFTLSADLATERGSRVAMLGPSGAGKSTLLLAIAGFHRPASGRIRLDGRDITGLAPGRRRVAMVFQDQNLFPHMSAEENVTLALAPDLRPTPEHRKEVAGALDRVGLEGLGPRRPAQLSGGQLARVTLARVLLQPADLILLDEPFAALGPGLRRDMLDLVASLCDETGRGLLMVTHDPADASAICPETIVVAEGRADPPRPTDEILGHPPPALADYLGVRSSDGTPTQPAHRPPA